METIKHITQIEVWFPKLFLGEIFYSTMEDHIKKKNFDQICRLCLEYASDTNHLFPLFQVKVPGFYGRFLKEFKESIPEIISSCIGIKVLITRPYFFYKKPLQIFSFSDWPIGRIAYEYMFWMRKSAHYIKSISTKVFNVKWLSTGITTDIWRRYWFWYGRWNAT